MSSRTCRNGAFAGSDLNARASSCSKRCSGGSHSGAVYVRIGHLAHSAREALLQRLEALEAVTGDRVAFDVTDAALVLALGRARYGAQARGVTSPVAAEGPACTAILCAGA